MPTLLNSFQFDDLHGELSDVVVQPYHDGLDWNLGRKGLFWLSGTGDPPSIKTAKAGDLLQVDMRSLGETVFALTGVDKTFYPLDGDQMWYPLLVEAVSEGKIVVSMTLELEWDFYPAPQKPADYKRHRFGLRVSASWAEK
jgi:hypothetical protein